MSRQENKIGNSGSPMLFKHSHHDVKQGVDFVACKKSNPRASGCTTYLQVIDKLSDPRRCS